MLYWTMFYTVVLNLTPATWFLIVAPFFVFLLMIVVGRKRVKAHKGDGIWAGIGKIWGQIGLCLLGITILAYAIDIGVGYFKVEYNQEYYEVLRKRTSKIGNANVRKMLVRQAASRIEETQLRDMANTYAAALVPEQRLPFLNSFLGSKLDPGLISWGGLLAKQPDNENAVGNFALKTTLPLDEAQRKLLESGDWPLFWPSLREEQWKYISKQMFVVQKQDAMIDILTNLVTELDPVESMRLAREMLNAQYIGPRHLAKRMANEAGRPELDWLFGFMISEISWLRGMIWLVVWLVVGLTIVAQAGRMKSSHRLFEVQHQ